LKRYIVMHPPGRSWTHFGDIRVAIRRHVLGGSFYRVVLYDMRLSRKGDVSEA
jgi:hypothetical protein